MTSVANRVFCAAKFFGEVFFAFCILEEKAQPEMRLKITFTAFPMGNCRQS